MRQFKFRAWDKKALRMSPAFHLFGEFTLIGGVHAWQDESNIPGDSLGRLNDLEIMQYLENNDKNGEYLCEGDIVNMEGTKATVVFWGDPPEFGLEPHNEDECCDDWNISDDSCRMEIIGNIYENPQLEVKPTITIKSSRYDDIDEVALDMLNAGIHPDEINEYIEKAVSEKVEKAVDKIGFKVESMDLKTGVMTIVPNNKES